MRTITKVYLSEEDLSTLRQASEILREIDKATGKDTLGSYWLTCDIDMLANRSAYDDDDGKPYFWAMILRINLPTICGTQYV